MPRPTGRGIALLGIAVGTYLAGRVVGTWELYLFALAFAAFFVLSWLSVALVAGQLQMARFLTPERPLADDEPEYTMVITNRAFLPGPQLTIRSRLTGLCARDLEQDIHTLAPRATRVVRDRLTRVNRGVHGLPAAEAVAEDPLGVVRVSRPATGGLTVTVYPRLVFLTSCVLFPEPGLRQDWAGRSGLASLAASEFRAVRPHQPGEPLSRIDWKSTAKTGMLMLREMEDPTGADVTVLLDGSHARLVGTPPHSNYEMAVRAAGSIADFALRAGRGVTLISHERSSRRIVLTPDGSGRRGLLEALAAVQPTASTPLAFALGRLLAEESRLRGAPSVTVVSLSLDEGLVRTLIGLREQGVRPAFVYVAGPSFATDRDQAGGAVLSFLPTAAEERNGDPRNTHRDSTDRDGAGRRGPGRGPAGQKDASGAQQGTSLSTEARALLLSLSAAGIPTLTLAYGDDLAGMLSGWGRGRRMPAAAHA